MRALFTAVVLLGTLLSGCGPASKPTPTPTVLPADLAGPAPTAELPRGVLAKITRTGGIAGVRDTIIIRADGSATFTDEDRYPHEPKPFLVSESVVQDLEAAFRSDEWRQLTKSYGYCAQCADYFYYDISGGGKTVIARELVEQYPPVLRLVDEHAIALFRVVDCTGGHIPTTVPQPSPTAIADC